jgi:hypothetical protein
MGPNGSGQSGAIDRSDLACHALGVPLCEGQLMDESETPAERADAGASAPPESASVIMAACENSPAAERMVASLGHDLRHQARKGDVNAFVVSRHRDGSFKLVQSQVLTAGGLGAAAIGFMTATMAGLLGVGAVFRGARTVTLSAYERQSHVRQADQRLAEVLDQVGQHSAVLLILCQDEQTGQTVAVRASERGAQSWNMSRAEFLGALDRLGDNYDWVRPRHGRPPRTRKLETQTPAGQGDPAQPRTRSRRVPTGLAPVPPAGRPQHRLVPGGNHRRALPLLRAVPGTSSGQRASAGGGQIGPAS